MESKAPRMVSFLLMISGENRLYLLSMSTILKNVPQSILLTEAKKVISIYDFTLKLIPYLIQSVDSHDSRLTLVALDLLFKLVADASQVINEHISSVLGILSKKVVFDNGLNPLVSCYF